jgi:hypothetical protein
MPAAASTLGQLVTAIQSYTQQLSSQSGYMRKMFTALAILFGILWMWRRIEHARQAERRVRQLRDAHGNIMPPNIALGQHMPSPLPPPHSSAAASSSSASAAIDVRHLSSSDRYLTSRGSRVRRQSVCITITPGDSHVFQTPKWADSASSLAPIATPLALRDALVPILMSLAQHTVLHLICMEADKARQEAVIAALNSCELFGLGLQRHRVLFCTTLKGKCWGKDTKMLMYDGHTKLVQHIKAGDQVRPLSRVAASSQHIISS